MRKLISLLIAAALLLSVMITVPVYAEEGYKKGSVIKADIIMPEASEIAGIEGRLNYNSNTLQYKTESFEAPHIADIVYNTNKTGAIIFNSSQASQSYDISSDHIVISAQFTVLADISAPAITSVIEDAYTLNGIDFVDVPTDSQVIITLISDAAETTETAEATQSTGETQPSETSITLTAAKLKIYAGTYTIVTADVKKPVGKTVFRSSNTKVATVTNAGKVSGLKEGTVTITAENNSKTAIINIKIVRRTNTIKATANSMVLKAKYNKKVVFKKAKAFNITGAKGKVLFKKYKGIRSITVSSSGNITVKKGTKKGAYTIRVKVTAKGNTKYKSKTVVVKLKIKVK